MESWDLLFFIVTFTPIIQEATLVFVLGEFKQINIFTFHTAVVTHLALIGDLVSVNSHSDQKRQAGNHRDYFNFCIFILYNYNL